MIVIQFVSLFNFGCIVFFKPISELWALTEGMLGQFLGLNTKGDWLIIPH